MRAMSHNSRTNSAGRVHGAKHNDRNFDISKSDNIDPERVIYNQYWHRYKKSDPELTFEEVEKKYYESTFRDMLDQINANYIKNRHPERCKTMDEFMKMRQYCPEETTLQIGKMEEHVDLVTFTLCLSDFIKFQNEWNKSHGFPFAMLNMAMHADEAVPHHQQRRVWKYTGDDGIIRIGQEKSLEAAGVPLPYPDQPVGRKNNRKMTFDKEMREKWLDICEYHGIQIDREPVPDGKHNRDKEDMIRDKYDAILEQCEALQRTLDGQIRSAELEKYKNRIKELEDLLRHNGINVPKENTRIIPGIDFL